MPVSQRETDAGCTLWPSWLSLSTHCCLVSVDGFCFDGGCARSCHTLAETIQQLRQFLGIVSTPSAGLGVVLQKTSCAHLPIAWLKQVLPCFSVPHTREGGVKSAAGCISDGRERVGSLSFFRTLVGIRNRNVLRKQVICIIQV